MQKIILTLSLCLVLLTNSEAQKDSTSCGAVSNQRLINASIASGAMLALGLWSFDGPGIWNKQEFQTRVRNEFPNFQTHADDYIQFAPGVAVYALDWCGVKARNDFWNRSILLFKAELLNSIITVGMKNYFGVLRPDLSNFASFPSGHTSQAFVAATFMHFELGEKSIWYSVGAYTVASATGMLRIMNNKHWLPDVVCGAAIGTISTVVVYKTHRYRWGKRPGELAILPMMNEGMNGVYLSYRF